MSKSSLTIVSVVYKEALFWKRNVALTLALNRDACFQWIVVDNSEQAILCQADLPRVVQLIAGAARPNTRDMGSLHHAMGLESGLQSATTQFVLLLDPDFYVLRPGWINSILTHMREAELALLGSVWHPRWHYQYRRFPTVHCMFIDTSRIAADELCLRPLISRDKWWNFINNRSIPMPSALRNTLKSQRIRDTGWQLYNSHRQREGIRYETLIPHYVRPARGRALWEQRLARLLPNSWLKYPADGDRSTTQSLLRARFPAAYALGWEEFFWNNEPFAIHLRRVGRSMTNDSSERDRELLESVLADVSDVQPGAGA